MRGFIPFLLAAICLLLIGTITAAPLQRTASQHHWSIDIGTGLFQPGDDLYEARFREEPSFRLGLNYKFHSRFILGLQYRFVQENTDPDFPFFYGPSQSWPGFIYGFAGQTENHWFGLKAGYDLVKRSTAEISLSSLFYIVRANVNERAYDASPLYDPGDRGASNHNLLQYGHTGIGLGAQFLFAYELSKRIALGIEVEYSETWLGSWAEVYVTGTDPREAIPGPLYAYDNVGGFWLAPFVRFEF